MVRVVWAVRASTASEKGDSPERQLEKLQDEVSRRPDVDVVGTATDRGVSRLTAPATRPELGKWFTPENLGRWDEVWVTTQDRLHGDTRLFLEFAWFVRDRGKTLRILDDPSFDMGTDEGVLLGHLKALGPAKEIQAIKRRIQASHDARRYTECWQAGTPPFGYRTEPKWFEGHDGHQVRRMVLVPDPVDHALLRQIRDWVIEGESLQGVARRLNLVGEPTPKDRANDRVNRPRKGYVWDSHTVTAILTSRATLGVKMKNRKPMYKPDGSPLVIAEPLLSQGEFDELQQILESRKLNKRQRTNRLSKLNGIAKCPDCGRGAYYHPGKGGSRDRYRCVGQVRRGIPRCKDVSIPSEYLEHFVEDAFMKSRGDCQVTTRRWQAAEDHTAELEQVRAALTRLEDEKDMAATWSDEDEASYQRRTGNLRTKRDTLAALPQRQAGWVYEPTGKTYREAWDQADDDGRRRMLHDAGVKAYFKSGVVRVRVEPPNGEPGEPTWLIGVQTGASSAEIEERMAAIMPKSP